MANESNQSLPEWTSNRLIVGFVFVLIGLVATAIEGRIPWLTPLIFAILFFLMLVTILSKGKIFRKFPRVGEYWNVLIEYLNTPFIFSVLSLILIILLGSLFAGIFDFESIDISKLTPLKSVSSSSIFLAILIYYIVIILFNYSWKTSEFIRNLGVGRELIFTSLFSSVLLLFIPFEPLNPSISLSTLILIIINCTGLLIVSVLHNQFSYTLSKGQSIFISLLSSLIGISFLYLTTYRFYSVLNELSK